MDKAIFKKLYLTSKWKYMGLEKDLNIYTIDYEYRIEDILYHIGDEVICTESGKTWHTRIHDIWYNSMVGNVIYGVDLDGDMVARHKGWLEPDRRAIRNRRLDDIGI